MEIVRSMHPDYLVNSWLVIDQPGEARASDPAVAVARKPLAPAAVLIDSGGPVEPIMERLEEDGLNLTHVICTHRHPDHIEHNEFYKQRFQALIAGPEQEAQFIGPMDLPLKGGEILQSRDLELRILSVPGHTAGHLAVFVNDLHLFPGDVLFRGTVGGTCGVGASGYEDLHHSVMEVLMKLPHDTQVHPGHMDSTTIGREWEQNPFVRYWRGLPPDQPEIPCRAFDHSAVLLVDAVDYDGGTKCLVRFDQTAALEIVPGSKVVKI